MTHPPARRTAPPPRTLAIHAGGAERIDGVLEHAVAPAVGRVPLEHWSFVRWTGRDGAHLRLMLDDPELDLETFAAHLSAGLERATAAPPREPLLPRPASQRATSEQLGVQQLQPADAGPSPGPLDELSSAIVLRALPELDSGRARCAYGLCVMATIAQAALQRDAGPQLWRDAAERSVGGDARGRRLLDGLAAKAGHLGPDLVELARRLRHEDALAGGLTRYAEGCAELSDAAAVRRHAHLACNRLGVTPLEETLLALVLAGAGCRRLTPGRAVVQLEQVSKDGDERALLDDVSLTVYEGEVFVVVGPPGAGKSSLLGIAAGLRVASGGKALVLGEEARAGRRDGARAPALVMPDGELALESTARENVELHLRATDDADGPGLVDEALEAAGLHAQAGTVAGELDRGQRRRLAIACALVADPSVLLLDEPTATLSAVERDEVWRVVDRRRDLGATTIIATTSLQEALCTGDRAGLMLGGSLRAVGDPARLARDFFPQRSVHFHVTEKPDRALLDELPEVRDLEIDERADHWAIEITTRQPRELLALLEADPEFPELHNVDEQGIDGPFAARQEA